MYFEKGIPSKLVIGNETITDSLALFKRLNVIGYEHGERLCLRTWKVGIDIVCVGIGRVDIVENRFIGLKSRGCYESVLSSVYM